MARGDSETDPELKALYELHDKIDEVCRKYQMRTVAMASMAVLANAIAHAFAGGEVGVEGIISQLRTMVRERQKELATGQKKDKPRA